MREDYGTCSVIRSFVHSFIRSVQVSCRDHRSLLKLGKGMNRLSTTMACNLTVDFAKVLSLLVMAGHLDDRL